MNPFWVCNVRKFVVCFCTVLHRGKGVVKMYNDLGDYTFLTTPLDHLVPLFDMRMSNFIVLKVFSYATCI